jgi:hypothetical protein
MDDRQQFASWANRSDARMPLQRTLDAYEPFRFITTRSTSLVGMRVEVIEVWSDGNVTRREMGAAERAAWFERLAADG